MARLFESLQPFAPTTSLTRVRLALAGGPHRPRAAFRSPAKRHEPIGDGLLGLACKTITRAPSGNAGFKRLVRPKGLEPLLQAPEACVISTSLRAQPMHSITRVLRRANGRALHVRYCGIM